MGTGPGEAEKAPRKPRDPVCKRRGWSQNPMALNETPKMALSGWAVEARGSAPGKWVFCTILFFLCWD